MDSERPSLDAVAADLGARWEIVDTGITVKLYPSCAGTHPTLDALLDLQRRAAASRRTTSRRSRSASIRSCRRSCSTTGRRAGWRGSSACRSARPRRSCTAASASRRSTPRTLRDPAIAALQARVTMRVDPTLDASAPSLTQARVTVRLRDGRVLTASANGARGYPERPASDDELAAKFTSCATQSLSASQAADALAALRAIESVADIRALTAVLADARLEPLRAAPSGLRSARHVAALPDHERARELDDRRLVLIDAGRLDADDADVRAATSIRASRAPRCASRPCRPRTAGSAGAPRPIPGWPRRSSSGRSPTGR